ncbi:MAG: hypothetical protein EXS37_10925 [Opitutus sp.]|nr:hypothetical protein [Opitutus sp.]
MDSDDQKLLRFLGVQMRDYGGRVEIDDGLWTLFAVEATDPEGNAVAGSLLRSATFVHAEGTSADDRWTLYYVDTANKVAAIQWLEELSKVTAGEIRPVSAVHRALIQELIGSAKPHRIAQQLADLHSRGEIGAGVIQQTGDVRSLLDRLHQCEPLFFSAFLVLLNHHLIDMLVLHRQLLPEDIDLKNEIVRGALSRDPFLQSRQDAAGEIRNTLLRFHLINPIDQHKNTAIANPYAGYLEVVVVGDEVSLPIDAIAVAVPRPDYLNAIHTVRRNLYRGEQFGDFDLQATWMNQKIAYPFRFIKQRVDARTDLAVMDTLYMLERAVET